MRALVTGGTGFIGRQLIARLVNPVVLTRNRRRTGKLIGAGEVFEWQPSFEPPPLEAFADVDVVFHLAGEPLGGSRWTRRRKERIRRSRIVGTRNLVKGVLAADAQRVAIISASATGYYGDRGDEFLTEESTPGTDFLAETWLKTERELKAATNSGIRVVMCRVGVVLGSGGGVVSLYIGAKTLRTGRLAPRNGPWMPWIHIQDVIGLLLHAARSPAIEGPMNVVAPNPERFTLFEEIIADHLNRRVPGPLPYFLLRAVFGEFIDVLRASRRVVPSVALRNGYHFRYPELRRALNDILS